MEATRPVNEDLLSSHSTKKWIHERMVGLISSESTVPTFSTAATKLTSLLQKPDVNLDDLSAVLALDPGLATRCLRAAQSVGRGGHRVHSVHEAVLVIGVDEVRRFALTLGVMNNFSHLRIPVDWDRFWLHSVLVARLTERLAGGFRETQGFDYIAGLLHDVGKLLIQHYFPREFELVIMRAQERKCGHAQIEMDVLGLDHSQVSAAICDVLRLPRQVVNAVRYHHEPLLPDHTANPRGDQGFLSACISVADTMANLGHVNIEGAKVPAQPFEELPEWVYLNEHFSCRGLELDLENEINRASSDIAALN